MPSLLSNYIQKLECKGEQCSKDYVDAEVDPSDFYFSFGLQEYNPSTACPTSQAKEQNFSSILFWHKI